MREGYTSKLKRTLTTLLWLAISLAGIQLIRYVVYLRNVVLPPPIDIFLDLVTWALIAFFTATIFIRFTDRRIVRIFENESDVEQAIFISKIYSFTIYAIATSVIIWKSGVSAGNITVFVGLITTGVAFAIRDFLVSYLAWFIIMNQKPFRLHDRVQIGDYTGIVESIGNFFVVLKDVTGRETFVVPNGKVLTYTIRNLGREKFFEKFVLPVNSFPQDCEQRIEPIRQFLEAQVVPGYLYYKLDSSGEILQIEFKIALDLETIHVLNETKLMITVAFDESIRKSIPITFIEKKETENQKNIPTE